MFAALNQDLIDGDRIMRFFRKCARISDCSISAQIEIRQASDTRSSSSSRRAHPYIRARGMKTEMSYPSLGHEFTIGLADNIRRIHFPNAQRILKGKSCSALNEGVPTDCSIT